MLQTAVGGPWPGEPTHGTELPVYTIIMYDMKSPALIRGESQVRLGVLVDFSEFIWGCLSSNLVPTQHSGLHLLSTRTPNVPTHQLTLPWFHGGSVCDSPSKHTRDHMLWSASRRAAVMMSLLPRRGVTTTSSSSSVPLVLGEMLRRDLLPADVQAMAPQHESSTTSAVPSLAMQKTAVVYDADALTSSFDAVQAAFPPHFVHALAIKSAPLAFIVREAIHHGMGIECASFGELASAVRQVAPR